MSRPRPRPDFNAANRRGSSGKRPSNLVLVNGAFVRAPEYDGRACSKCGLTNPKGRKVCDRCDARLEER
jgi:hypothetical protein